MLNLTLDDLSKITIDDIPFDEGYEKVAFASPTKDKVVLLFKDSVLPNEKARADRLLRLRRIVTEINPTGSSKSHAKFWQEHFLWPVNVLSHEQSDLKQDFCKRHALCFPPLGVVVPHIPQEFYCQSNEGKRTMKKAISFLTEARLKWLPIEVRGTLKTKLVCCARIARAIRKLHFLGTVHTDISGNNVLIDLVSGKALIIDNDGLAIKGIAPPLVQGTKGYCPPEVVGGSARASVYTDAHALAVLLYELLLLRHPLDGRKVYAEDPDEDEVLRFGPSALFVEHPVDKSNRPEQNLNVSCNYFGPHLSALFEQAFVRGLHSPHFRPTASDWESGLYKTLDLLHPSGSDWRICNPFGKHSIGNSSSIPFGVFLADANSTFPKTTNHALVVYDGLILYAWHTKLHVSPTEGVDRSPQAYCRYENGTWKLTNQSSEPMIANGKVTIRPGYAVELVKGLEIKLSTNDGRVIRFDFCV